MDRDTWIQAMRDKLNRIREPLPAAAFRPGKGRSRRFGRKYERLAAGPNLSARRRRLIADTRIEYNDAFAEAASYFTPPPDFKSRAVFRAPRKRLVGQSRDARDFGPSSTGLWPLYSRPRSRTCTRCAVTIPNRID
jgi:hypothetical protein